MTVPFSCAEWSAGLGVGRTEGIEPRILRMCTDRTGELIDGWCGPELQVKPG
jgi:hypothetical protein